MRRLQELDLPRVELERMLEDGDEHIRAAAIRLLGAEDCSEHLLPLAASVGRPTPPAVIRALEDIGLRCSESLGRAPRGQLDPARRLRQRWVFGRTQETLEAIMSDEAVPGFYDGQFRRLWPIDPTVSDLLLEIAKDPSYHFVARVLAVMALHDSQRPNLAEDLAPLILDEREEFFINRQSFFSPRVRRPADLEIRRLADLSRYARFSLAKAGIVKPIQRMIRKMDEELELNRGILESRGSEDGRAITAEDWHRIWLRNLLFETGYYFQQFDDYDSAVKRYRELVERYPESDACQNAYYNLACIASIRKRPAEALRSLNLAVQLGFTDHEWLLEDGDLAPLRELPEFQRIVENARMGKLNEDFVDGSTWLSRLVPFLPPGKLFFELEVVEQMRVLKEHGGELTAAERSALLEVAPPDLVSVLREILGQTSPREIGGED